MAEKFKISEKMAQIFQNLLDFVEAGAYHVGEKTVREKRTISMIDIILHEPEIPMNTGNIARTCACTGARLHLIRPLGFDISDRAVKRAGLDYWQYVDLTVYDDLDDFFAKNGDEHLWLATTKAPRAYAQAELTGDVKLMFGKETAGLPEWLRERYRDRCIRIPMIGPVRSLNLANSVAILCYEALRQQGFPNLKASGSMLDIPIKEE